MAKVLSLKLPMIGSTTEDNEGLSTRILTVLIREVSQDECQKWMSDRFLKIMHLDSRFSSYGANTGQYVRMEDNGC